jgi:DICT domain-containing protein
MRAHRTGFAIGEVVERTGVAEATLRMWEHRYGFPTPERLASGHRRYSEQDVELIGAVVAKRAAGLALPVAIEQARSEVAQPAASVYAALRRRRPDLEPRLLLKPMMLALSQAIEDEALARGEQLIVFGSFQRERFYRQAQSRWRELARTAAVAVVFADFTRLRTPRHGPVEVPVPRDHPLNREWALVCEGQDFALCMAGWEPPGRQVSDGMRRFEAIWSVEPEIVREASRICGAIATARRPAVAAEARPRLDAPLSATPQSQLRLASAVTARMLSHVSSQLIRGAR